MRTRNSPFEDRTDAALSLAETLEDLHSAHNVCVLGLPRGGVSVAKTVALQLHLPFDILVVRKLPTPGNPELAMGALAEFGAEALNPDILRWIPEPEAALLKAKPVAQAELSRRAALYRGGRPSIQLKGRHVLLVDDGAATGATMRAAIQGARNAGAERITVALPVAPPETCGELAALADEVRCLWRPEYFQSVGSYYRHFPQVTDIEVVDLLSSEQTPAHAPVSVPI